MGITEGVAKAVTDIFTGLYDLLNNLFTDPIGFFGGLATAITNPIDTATQMWGAVEVAWERDVVNGDARSRAEFFSYATVSVFGLKGVDKLGKVGKATSKADTALPYNALKTDKLQETVKANVYANVQQKTEQASNFWKSNFSKEAINKTIEAAKNSAVMTKAKNTLDSANIKETATKTYQDVVKTPIAKTQAAWEKKKDQLLDMPLPNLGLSPVPLGPTTNMTVREGIEAAQNTVMQMVWKKDGGGETTKGTGKEYKNYKAVEYTGTTKVNGEERDISRRVFQRIDIDYKRIDPDSGMTNFQLMKKGRAPIWKDGTVIELHHLIQREPGAMVEIPASMHDEYNKILHGLVENGGSFRNDPVLKKQYDNFRSKYWRWRAKQIDKSEL